MADAPVWDATRYRHVSTSSLTLYVPISGLAADEEVQLQIDSGDGVHAVPWLTGHGGTLTGCQIQLTVPDSSAMLRLAFYSRTSSFDAYPSRLLADVGSILCASATTTVSFAPIVTSANDQWWLAFAVDRTTRFDGLDTTGLPIVYGRSRLALDSVSPGLRYIPLAASSAWPATFPASANAATAIGDKIPHVAFRIGSAP
jgi:hypothetical protein